MASHRDWRVFALTSIEGKVIYVGGTQEISSELDRLLRGDHPRFEEAFIKQVYSASLNTAKETRDAVSAMCDAYELEQPENFEGGNTDKSILKSLSMQPVPNYGIQVLSSDDLMAIYSKELRMSTSLREYTALEGMNDAIRKFKNVAMSDFTKTSAFADCPVTTYVIDDDLECSGDIRFKLVEILTARQRLRTKHGVSNDKPKPIDVYAMVSKPIQSMSKGEIASVFKAARESNNASTLDIGYILGIDRKINSQFRITVPSHRDGSQVL